LSVNNAQPQYHTHLVAGDVGRYVLMPGDPARCAVIAAYLQDAEKVAQNREYTTYTGTLDGVPVSVTSTGIGSPSAAIALEELAEIGVDTFIRVGTSGALQNYLATGDVVIAQAAVRGEGTTSYYVPLSYPAVAHPVVLRALEDGARAVGVAARTGIVTSADALYADVAPHTMPLAALNTGDWGTVWTRAGVLAAEMECAALFVIGTIRGLRAGGVLTVVNATGVGEIEQSAARVDLDPMIRAALAGVAELIRLDSPPAS
jgi:uridine phosphorylase